MERLEAVEHEADTRHLRCDWESCNKVWTWVVGKDENINFGASEV
jgi:hypothetical protein